jgi:hypothetical protein
VLCLSECCVCPSAVSVRVLCLSECCGCPSAVAVRVLCLSECCVCPSAVSVRVLCLSDGPSAVSVRVLCLSQDNAVMRFLEYLRTYDTSISVSLYPLQTSQTHTHRQTDRRTDGHQWLVTITSVRVACLSR